MPAQECFAARQATPTPPPAEKPPKEAKKALPEPPMIQGTVWFAFDSDKLDRNAKMRLAELVEQINQNADYRVIMAVGHASRVGSAEYNLELSKRRVNAVKAELVARGLDRSKIEVSAKGFDSPLVDPERTTEDRDKNQRVDIKVIMD